MIQKNLRILGLDSSTPQGSAALLENDQVLSEKLLPENTTCSNQLLRLVDEVLSESGLDFSEVDGFAVTTGPGSFTGLRVGVSLIKGFVLSVEKPFVSIDTLEAVAARVDTTPHQICAVLDARKKEVYSAMFRFEGGRMVRQTQDQAMSPLALCESISEPCVFTGSGLKAYRELFTASLGSLFVEARLQHHSVAASAALLAQQRFESKSCLNLDSLTIKYIRKSEAELNFVG